MAYERDGRGRDSSRDEPRRSSRDAPPPRRSMRNEEPERGSARGRDREEPERGRDRGGRDEPRGASGRSRSGFQYQPRSAEAVKHRAESGGNDFDNVLADGTKVFKPHDGDNLIRIVPATFEIDGKRPEHYGLDVYVHYGVGPDRNTYLDLAKMKGEADPITEEYVIMQRDSSGSEEDKEALKQLAAKHRVLVYLVDRDDEKAGLQAWLMPAGLDQDIVKVSIDKATGAVLQIDDPEEGFDISFVKSGKGIGTKYTGAAVARRDSPLGKQAWLDEAEDNPLPDILVYYDYDHIAKAFNGGGAHRTDRGRGREDPGRNERDAGRSGQSDRDADTRDARSSRSREEPPERDFSGRDEGRGSSRREESSRSRASEAPTWDSVHAMTPRELDDLIAEERLEINPDEAKDDADLADWICDEMKLKEPAPRRDPDPDRDAGARLRNMREQRVRN